MAVIFNIAVGLIFVILGIDSFDYYAFRDKHKNNWDKLSDYTYSYKAVLSIILGLLIVFQVIDLASYLL